MAVPGLVKPQWFLILMIMGIVFILIYFWYSSKGDKTDVAAIMNLGKRKKTHQFYRSDLKTESLPINFQMNSIMNLPEWFRNKDWGLRKNVYLENVTAESGGSGETAWNNFFFGTTGGLMLELGAMDGKTKSVSDFFENEANWRTMLIEGNPRLSKNLSINRPNSLNLNLVICDQPRLVHYVVSSSALDSMDGVLEFMSEGYLHSVYPNYLDRNGKLDMKKVENTTGIIMLECLPLTQVLTPFKINHINFFLLDVEGGELKILNTIDFDKFTFDVIAVQTNRISDSPEFRKKYEEEVIELLTSKGYALWNINTGSLWFVSLKFQPFKKT